jgi:hypothetical protein
MASTGAAQRPSTPSTRLILLGNFSLWIVANVQMIMRGWRICAARWRKEDEKRTHALTTNPVTGITIRLGKPQKLRGKGLTEEEAQAILQAR